MSLEAATFIQSLDANNPVASDRKSQGDDHLRLVKAVLKASFPNLTGPIYMPKTSSAAADVTLNDAHYNGTVFISTSGSAITVTLNPTLDGWNCRIVKVANGDPNPVFVTFGGGIITPVGTIAKSRISVANDIQEFYYSGSMTRVTSGVPYPGTVELQFGALASGYTLLSGASFLRVDCPELFAVWGTAYGAADGTHFSIPSVLDRFFVGAGSAYAIGATGGEATHTLTLAELAAHAHSITQNPHDHSITGGTTGLLGTGADTLGGNSPVFAGAALDVGTANADITINNSGGGGAHENRPPYMAVYPAVRLC